MSTYARLRALVAVADTGSVRVAAARLCITESSVSSAITALSGEIGTALLEREGRGIALTPAGHCYAGYARRIMGLSREAVDAALGAADPEQGTVRLAAVTTAGEQLLPELLASFRAEHPHVTLGLEVAIRDVVWPMLAHHDVDLVVAGRPPTTAGGRVRALRSNTLVVVGPPTLGPEGSEVPPGTSWLLREPGSGMRETTLAVLDGLGPTMTLGSHGAVAAATAAGLGVTLVSRFAVREHLAAGRLVELSAPGTPLERPWHLVSQNEASAPTELLIAHLVEHAELGWHTAHDPVPFPRTGIDPADPRDRCADPDRTAPYSDAGTVASTVVSDPGRETTRGVPPTSSARSVVDRGR